MKNKALNILLACVLAIAMIPAAAVADSVSVLAPGTYGTANFSVNDTIDAFETDVYKEYRAEGALGTAGSFHIVAFNNAALSSDVYGNVLAANVSASHTFGIAHRPSISYIQHYGGTSSNLDKNAQGVLVLGSKMEVSLHGNPLSYKTDAGYNVSIDAPRNIIQDADSATTPFISLSRVKDEMKGLSSRLAAHKDEGASFDFADQNKKTIKYEKNGGCAYLSMTASDFASNSNKVEIIGMPDDGSATLVINVDCSDIVNANLPDPIDLSLGGIKASFGETDTRDTGYVLFNFINADNKTISLHSMVGAAIALGATLELGGNGYGNSCGTFVAENVNVSAESHYRHFDGDFDEDNEKFADISLSGDKTVEGNVPQESFDFALSSWNGNKWVAVSEVSSDETGHFAFGTVPVSVNGASEKWLRIVEKNAEGFVCSPAAIYVKANITETEEGIKAPCEMYASEKIFDDAPVISEMMPIADIAFDNAPVSTQMFVEISKKWENTDNVLDSIFAVVVAASGDIIERICLSAETGWQKILSIDEADMPVSVYEEDDFGQYKEAGDVVVVGDKSYDLSVEETAIADKMIFALTNTLKDQPVENTVSIVIDKRWENDEASERPDEVSFALYAKTVDNPRVLVEEIIVDEASNWHWEGSGYPAFDADKNDYSYILVEKDLPDYSAVVKTVFNEEANAWTFTVVNTKVPEETLMTFSLRGYSMAAVGAAAAPEKTCYVDPKITKVLSGRVLRDGEFAFQLVDEKTGRVVSTASNDALGMVDFDAAANIAPEGMEPCCLEFHAPGIYTYAVKESADVAHDPSVRYSAERVRFVAEVVENDDGALVCQDMYYLYYKDADDKVGVRTEATEHPTITNETEPISIKLRKTSIDDNAIGLAGAVYGLWQQTDEGDIKVAVSSISDEDGYMFFESEDISLDTPYYFVEETAPAGYMLDTRPSTAFKVVQTDNGNYIETIEETPRRSEMASFGDTLEYTFDGGVKDIPLSFAIDKLASDTEKRLSGAQMEIVNKDGNIVAKWETDGESIYVVSGGFIANEKLELREVSAPDGYEAIEPVGFSVSERGEVVLEGASETAYVSNSTIIVVDKANEEKEDLLAKTEGVSFLAQTSDETPDMAVEFILLASAALVAFGVLARRRIK